jgi:hypothetical protein
LFAHVCGKQIPDELAEIAISALIDEEYLGFVVELLWNVDAYLDIVRCRSLPYSPPTTRRVNGRQLRV